MKERILSDMNGNHIYEGDEVELREELYGNILRTRGVIHYHNHNCLLLTSTESRQVFLTDKLIIIKPKLNRTIYALIK